MIVYGPFPPPTKPPEILTEILKELDEMIAEQGDRPHLLKWRAETLEMLEAYK